jgi:3-deoxy-D-manno-octulosonic acid kinase
MNPAVHSENHQLIVYDADRIPEPDASLFSSNHWQKEDAITGKASGRGTTLLLDTKFGPAVLRHYRRGGWPAKFSKDRYLFTGIGRSRPYREFHLLRKMTALGLPVPAPLAALIENSILTYRGSLLMEQIMDVSSFAARLPDLDDSAAEWPVIGKCIRRFHQAGVSHADLNAHNIQINSDSKKVFLVDFDRCTLTPGSVIAGRSNLARLKRSLAKLWSPNNRSSQEACWQALLDGYHD